MRPAGGVGGLTGVVLDAVSGALFAGVAFLMIRNLVRLWKVPSREVGLGSLIALALAGVRPLGLFGEGPLVEARRTEDRLLGACLVVVAVALLVLAARPRSGTAPTAGPRPVTSASQPGRPAVNRALRPARRDRGAHEPDPDDGQMQAPHQ